MDPFSIATGSAGLVSIGMTICDGLVTYCRSYSSRSNDLLLISQHAERLQVYLRLLEERQHRGLTTNTSLKSAIQACLDACGVCLREFNTLNDKYSQQLPSTSLKSHGKAVVQKLQYPFQKDKFESFRRQMHEFHFALSNHVVLMNYDLTTDLRHGTLSELKKLAFTTSVQGRELSHQISSVVSDLKQALDHRVTRLEESLQNQLESLQKLITVSLQSHQKSAQGQNTIFEHTTDIDSDTDCTRASLLLRPLALQRSAPGTPISSSCGQNQTPVKWTARFSQGPLLDCECRWATAAHRTHAKTCIYSFQNRRKRVLVGKLRVFDFLFKCKIAIQCSQHAFTRDFQICSNFTLRAICNWSPAFDLVYSTYRKTGEGLTVEELRKELRTCLIGVRQSFIDGKAWPTDILGYNMNLLHIACYGIRFYLTDEKAGIFLQYLKELIALGVPINDGYNTPLYALLHQSALWTFESRAQSSDWDSTHLTTWLARELIEHGAELSGESVEPLSGFGGLYNLPLHLRSMVGLPPPLDYGDLSCALLQESEPNVRRLLSTSKLSILERGRGGETPLHLTICWARGIELLLELGEDTTQAIIEARDAGGNTPLTYALKLGQFESARLLLRAHAKINLEDTLNIENRVRHKWSCAQSDRIISFLSYTLANRRKELSSLALEWLTNDEASYLLPQGQHMLQENAFEVVKALQKRSTNIPWYYLNIRPGSIYHSLYMSANLAEALLQAGFDHANVMFHGFSPLMTVSLSRLTHRRALEGTLDLVDWFMNHGADINSPIPLAAVSLGSSSQCGKECFKIIHRIAYEAGAGMYRTRISGSDEARITQLRGILTEPSIDPCNCYCVRQGCTPASLFTRGMMESSRGSNGMAILRDGVAIVQYVVSSGQVPIEVVRDIIRACTFSRLEMKHTCCTYIEGIDCSCGLDVTRAVFEGRYRLIDVMDPEDIADIQDEDRHLAVRLEALVEEFDAKFSELGQPFGEFFWSYLWRRMDEVDAEVDNLSPEDVAAIRETGVVFEDG